MLESLGAKDTESKTSPAKGTVDAATDQVAPSSPEWYTLKASSARRPVPEVGAAISFRLLLVPVPYCIGVGQTSIVRLKMVHPLDAFFLNYGEG